MTVPNYSEMFQGEPTLLPGVIRGYRCWNVADGWLTSTGVEHVWARELDGQRLPGTTVEGATCMRGSRYAAFPVFPGCPCRTCTELRRVQQQELHEAPDQGCSCGIYGWYSPDDVRIVDAPVFGAIEVSGRVIAGSHGFRAQRARVLALVQTGNADVDRALAQRGYEVHPSHAALLEQYPPDDVSALIDHTCDERCELIAELSQGKVFAVMQRMATSAVARVMIPPSVFFPPGSVITWQQANPALVGFTTPAADEKPPAPSDETPEPEPPTPRERALLLRQNRNTGPTRKSGWWR